MDGRDGNDLARSSSQPLAEGNPWGVGCRTVVASLAQTLVASVVQVDVDRLGVDAR